MNEEMEFLIMQICDKQNYDALLRQVIKSDRESNVKTLLNEINNDKDIPMKQKQKIYETIFDYINYANEELINNIKDIFKRGVEEGLKSKKSRNYK